MTYSNKDFERFYILTRLRKIEEIGKNKRSLLILSFPV